MRTWCCCLWFVEDSGGRKYSETMRGNGNDFEGEGGLGFGEEEGEQDRGMDLFKGSLMGRNGSKGESSGCSGEETRDPQHKRAKVYVDG
ncbi:hypothetical protein MLD38_006985 [Melastoma candidum]|uniref:Uncharacterized protein n=1 Tax=Melastoma candidum TaxID=119954 RepID=A0ACB9RR07_9MYRT|nr:hypothetical protein MLD38_006985 [Melastoma candidum]